MSERVVPSGLTNLGNTCFLNSCVQLLNVIDELVEIPPLEHPLTNVVKEEDRAVFCEWRELREFIRSAKPPHSPENIVVTPGKFVKTIHEVARMKGRDLFTGWAQNDLPEFLLLMIECMHNYFRREVAINIRGSSESDTDDLAFQCYSMLRDNYQRGDYSEISEIFYGVYVSRLFTPDGNTRHSNKPESYCLLDLPIPLIQGQGQGHRHHTNISLLDCFDEFIADELLTGWFNEKTGQKEPVRKNIIFWSFPPILIIILKRYSPDGRYKNDRLIDFPLDHLDLSKYVVGYRANSYKYELFGVANHMGGVAGGHYTAFVRPTNNNRWFCCNDSCVTEISPNIVVSASAYCIFYRKK